MCSALLKLTSRYTKMCCGLSRVPGARSCGVVEPSIKVSFAAVAVEVGVHGVPVLAEEPGLRLLSLQHNFIKKIHNLGTFCYN